MDISEVRLNHGVVFNMEYAKSFMRKNRHFSSMVDLPWDRIENIILQDGWEISLKDIRELSSKPESVGLGEMIGNY